ncbi:MAG: hypothetical protein GVY31_01160 [Alphaproteobacteria bacterium]|jgi:hypothetical protein|nr:hypothetical protein [Alphaproteobacteria bacterium]
MLGFLERLFGKGRAEAASGAAPQVFRPLPPPDSARDYAELLEDVLAAHDRAALAQIAGALADLPDTTRELHFGVHPDQDGEGTFSVMIHPEGPELHVLNAAISEYRKLFGIKHMEGGLNVPVPLFDFDEVDYEVNDVIADTAMDWVDRLWMKVHRARPDLPVLVFCAEEWGNPPARWLQGAPE